MGLDMYLLKKRKDDKRKVEEIWDEVGYFRKVNAVHKYLVDQAQEGKDDCGYHKVKKEVLEDLVKRCEEVLNKVVLRDGMVEIGRKYQNGKEEPILSESVIVINPEVCEELLPTQDGFFFGGISYNGYYLDDLKDTINICNNILSDTDFTKEEIYYHSSW